MSNRESSEVNTPRPARKVKPKKLRLDDLLVELGYFDDRGQALRAVLAHEVRVDDVYPTSAAVMVRENADVFVRNRRAFVSRGGHKLQGALDAFKQNVEGARCIDIGSSTGGFTDCLLQAGALSVACVDVNYGQLAWKLRNDERVVCMEKTNIRYVTPEDIADPIGFASIDVSFISLTKVLGPVKALLEDNGQIVCLIKPQFEAGREKVGKKGVVREPAVHLEVIDMVIDYALSIGFEALNLEFSPIKGPEGNIEYLLYLQKHPEDQEAEYAVRREAAADPKAVVAEAHQTLDRS